MMKMTTTFLPAAFAARPAHAARPARPAHAARRFLCALVTLALAFAMLLPAGVAWANNDGNDNYYRVNDYSNTLTEDQELSLSHAAKYEEQQLQFDFVVYLANKDTAAADLAEKFYADNNCGYGPDDDGIIMVYNARTGDVAVHVEGLGAVIFSDIDTADLASAARSTFQTSGYDAVNNFLGTVVVKVADYRKVDVSARWPEAWAAAHPSASGASGSLDNTTDAKKEPTPAGGTTADLPWYPSDSSSFEDFHNDGYSRVIDEADLLTDEEEAQLAAKIADMSERTGLDFVLLTNTSSYGESRGLFAADYYQFNGYGFGDEYSGVIYYVCMQPGNRGFWTAARGTARELLTEDNVNYMDDRTYDLFVEGEYGKAIMTQFDNLDVLYTNGSFPFDWTAVQAVALIMCVAGCVGGVKRLRAEKAQMKTVAQSNNASWYRVGGVDFTVKKDTCLGTTKTRTKRTPPPSSGGSSSSSGSSSYSSSYSSSGGASFSGGGRSF